MLGGDLNRIKLGGEETRTPLGQWPLTSVFAGRGSGGKSQPAAAPSSAQATTGYKAFTSKPEGNGAANPATKTPIAQRGPEIA